MFTNLKVIDGENIPVAPEKDVYCFGCGEKIEKGKKGVMKFGSLVTTNDHIRASWSWSCKICSEAMMSSMGSNRRKT